MPLGILSYYQIYDQLNAEMRILFYASFAVLKLTYPASAEATTLPITPFRAGAPVLYRGFSTFPPPPPLC